MRKIKAIYTASDDPEFGLMESEEILIAPDVVFEMDDELRFLIIPPVPDDQDTVHIDRATCGYFALALLHCRDEVELDVDFLAEATFLDFIREYANNK